MITWSQTCNSVYSQSIGCRSWNYIKIFINIYCLYSLKCVYGYSSFNVELNSRYRRTPLLWFFGRFFPIFFSEGSSAETAGIFLSYECSIPNTWCWIVNQTCSQSIGYDKLKTINSWNRTWRARVVDLLNNHIYSFKRLMFTFSMLSGVSPTKMR